MPQKENSVIQVLDYIGDRMTTGSKRADKYLKMVFWACVFFSLVSAALFSAGATLTDWVGLLTVGASEVQTAVDTVVAESTNLLNEMPVPVEEGASDIPTTD